MGEQRRYESLGEIACRWACSRTTVRRVLRRLGVRPVVFGCDARNSLVRFDVVDVAEAEQRADRDASRPQAH